MQNRHMEHFGYGRCKSPAGSMIIGYMYRASSCRIQSSSHILICSRFCYIRNLLHIPMNVPSSGSLYGLNSPSRSSGIWPLKSRSLRSVCPTNGSRAVASGSTGTSSGGAFTALTTISCSISSETAPNRGTSGRMTP